MPTLTFTDSQIPKGGVLNSRVLIGRRLSHGVVLSDPTVSRLHAWIDPIADENAEWVLTDAGSKTGTFVNDQQIARHPLHDGDRIRVGSVILTYQDQDTLPQGVTAVEFSAPGGVIKSSGILFECPCGAPLWVGNELAGKRGMCRHCRNPVTVPSIPTPQLPSPDAGFELRRSSGSNTNKPPVLETASKPISSKHSVKCAVCHSEILDSEEQTQCPDCAMHFHAECWQENLGCSSYGCPQVNALQPADTPATALVEESAEAPATDPPRATPWEPILLGASVVGSLLGALLFGTMAALVAVFTMVILIKGKARRPALLIVAMVVSLLGIAAGLGVSDFWYFNARHLPSGLIRHP